MQRSFGDEMKRAKAAVIQDCKFPEVSHRESINN